MKYFHSIDTRKLIDRISGQQASYYNQSVVNRVFNHYAPDNYVLVAAKYIDSRKSSFEVKRIVDNGLANHASVDVRSEASTYSIEGMLDITSNTFNSVVTLGLFENSFSIFAVMIRGAMIGFYVYKSNPELLTNLCIPHYHGFVPLSYCMTKEQWAGLVTKKPKDYTGYSLHTGARDNIIHNSQILERIGVEKTPNLNYPHLYDFKNTDHMENIHALFVLLYQNEIQ